jgi:hypothetical protein
MVIIAINQINNLFILFILDFAKVKKMTEIKGDESGVNNIYRTVNSVTV